MAWDPGLGAWEPTTGDWVVCTRIINHLDPPVGSCHQVIGRNRGGEPLICWELDSLWPMYEDQTRPATLEEIARAQLSSLEGL